MNNKEIDNARADAAEALVKWAKKRVGYFPMRNAVNHYMEEAGINAMSINGEEGIRAHRKIAAQGMAIGCISALTNVQLVKVDRELDYIANDIPKGQNREIRL